MQGGREGEETCDDYKHAEIMQIIIPFRTSIAAIYRAHLGGM